MKRFSVRMSVLGLLTTLAFIAAACGAGEPAPTPRPTTLALPTLAPGTAATGTVASAPQPTPPPPVPTATPTTVSIPTPTPTQPTGQTRVVVGAAKDNTLYETSISQLSNGGGEHFFAGATAASNLRRALVSFDIAGSIPQGAAIESVQLTLYMSRSPSLDKPVELRRVTASWGEGASDARAKEGGGATAALGDATWAYRILDTALWANPGGDYATEASARIMVGGIGSYTWHSTTGMVADVQRWLDNPTANFGWLLLGDESGIRTSKRFDSRENPTGDHHPALTIIYTPAP